MCGEAKAAVAIVGLALPNRTLRGQVVVSLPSLAALRVLNLSGNAIRGALPARSTSSLRSRGGSATASSSLPCCCPLRPQHRQGQILRHLLRCVACVRLFVTSHLFPFLRVSGDGGDCG